MGSFRGSSLSPSCCSSAVRMGGATNHRTGLFDAILIKDNHLALGGRSAAEAVQLARDFVQQDSPHFVQVAGMIVEVEVDTLAQLDEVLPLGPDIVLLDNMTVDQLRQAVARRDAVNPAVELEASGGVNLQTVRGALDIRGVGRNGRRALELSGCV